jgi:Ca-activated chloride channel family protein
MVVEMRIVTLHLLLLGLFYQSSVSHALPTHSLPPNPAYVLLQQPDADSVFLTVTVTNKRGEYIRGLSRNDFTIYEGRSPLEISSFSFGDEPMSVGVVYDASMSMRQAKRTANPKVVREAVDRFVRSSNSSNSYFLISFSDQPQLLVDWTRDREALLRPLEAITAKGLTALYDACYMALDKLRGGEHRKRVILLISDGQDNSSRRNYRELRHFLMSSDVLLYAIPVTDGSEQDLLFEGGRAVLEELSSVTGGGTVNPRSDSELVAAVEQIAFELSRQYRIGFKPGNQLKDDKWRELKIKVTTPADAPRELRDLTVRSRRG